MSSTASDVADTTQNLRGGANFLIHDLTLAGRGIPTGGVPIPSGPGAGPILRPSPPGLGYNFDNIGATTMTAITSGSSLGPPIDGQATDMVTLLSIDPILDACLGAPFSVKPFGAGAGQPEMAVDGSSFSTGNVNNVRCADGDGNWLGGNSSQPAVKKGDLLLFTDPNGRNAIQTVTSTDNTNVDFATKRERHVWLQSATGGGRLDYAAARPGAQCAARADVHVVRRSEQRHTAADAPVQHGHAADAGGRRRGSPAVVRPGRWLVNPTNDPRPAGRTQRRDVFRQPNPQSVD